MSNSNIPQLEEIKTDVQPKTKEFSIPEDNPIPDWSNMPNADNIAYGIEVVTIESSDDPPTVTLYGTKGLSRELVLDNLAENFETKDYFLFSAEELNDIGHPLAIQFKAVGNDGWGFDNVKVDFFADQNKEWTAKSLKAAKSYNNRDKVLAFMGQPVVQVPFSGAGYIDGNGSTKNGITYDKQQTLYVAGPTGIKAKSGSPEEIEILTKYIVVDNSNGASPIPWNSSRSSTISSGQVESALQRKVNTKTEENTLAIGVSTTATATASDPLTGSSASLSTTVSMSNTFRVNQSDMKEKSNTSGSTGDQSITKVDGQGYKILIGNLTIIEMKISANVQPYTFNDNTKLKLFYSEMIDANYSLSVRNYRKDDNGQWQLVKVTTQGDENGKGTEYELVAPLSGNDLRIVKKAGFA